MIRKSSKRRNLRRPTKARKTINEPKLNLDGKIEEDDSFDDEAESSHSSESELEGSDSETADEKRRRLAKEYLTSMYDGDMRTSESTTEEVKDKLSRTRLRQQGRFFREIATSLNTIDDTDIISRGYNGHELSVTSVALSKDEKFICSGSKDNSVITWDTETGGKTVLRPKWSRSSHGASQCSDGEVLAVAVTTDGKYVASGGRDGLIRIYDPRTKLAEVNTLRGHKDAITSLCFKRDSYALFSGSMDRSVKHWDLQEMGYLETLFGHQDAVFALDCWTSLRPLSGSSDRSLRLWKVAEETHLVYRGHKGTVDTVQALTEDSFVSGGQDGSLLLWKASQKRPVASIHRAHGLEGGTDSCPGTPRWICGLGSAKMTDLVVSGSSDGFARVFEARASSCTFVERSRIKADGFVNGVSVSESGSVLVLGTGSEHRLGRWLSLRGNRNKVHVFRLPVREAVDDDEGEEEEQDEEDESAVESSDGDSDDSE